MNLYKKLLVILVILLFSIILYQIWKDKKYALTQLYGGPFINPSLKEGLAQTHPQYKAIMDEISKVAIDTDQIPGGYFSVDKNFRQLELKDFCIKSSFNSAYTGKSYISDEMVKYVLSRGCRLLDFEVFFNNNTPYVSYSPKPGDDKPSNDIMNNNQIPLTRMIIDTLSNAFVTQRGNKYFCTNIEDPLFIYIRLKTGKTNNPTEYGYIKDSLDAVKTYGGGVYRKYFYDKQVNKNTKIGDICNKVIFIFNNDGNDGIYNNMTAGAADSIIKYTYSDLDEGQQPKITPVPKKSGSNSMDLDKLRLVTIHDEAYNTKNTQNQYQIYASIRDYGCNFSLFKYYETDWKLLNTEKLFKHYNYGILPMAYALNYMNIYPSSDQLIMQIGIQ